MDFLGQIRKALTRRGYQADDFSMTESTTAEDATLTINYQFAPEYEVRAWIQTTENTFENLPVGSMGIKVVPGEVLHAEHHRLKDKAELLRAISAWVERVDAELKAIPINRELREQREAIEAIAAQFATDAEGYFTKGEANDLRARLDDIETRMQDGIKTAMEDDQEAKKAIAQLHAEIELLKSQLQSLTKKNWAKSAAIRAANWLKDPGNRELLGAGTDLAKKLLLPPGSGPGAV